MEWLWGVVIIGGPLLLLVALLVGRARAGKQAKRVDPTTPADDPSKGMPGHDRAPPSH